MNFGADSGNAIKRISGKSLTSVGILQCLLPEFGREFEDSTSGPVGEENEDVAEIAPGFDSVESRGSDERCEYTVPLAAVFTSQEEPIFPADHLLPERPFAVVVMNGNPAVFEKLKQGRLLISGVLQPFVNGRMFHGVGPFLIAPLEKFFGDRFGFLLPNAKLFVRRQAFDFTFDFEELSYQMDGMHREVSLACNGVEEIPTGMSPARAFDAPLRFSIQMVVDNMCVRDYVPFVIAEQLLHRVAVVIPFVEIEDMISIRDEHEEMPAMAFSFCLDQDAGGIGRNAVCLHGVFFHRFEQKNRKLGRLFDPGAHRSASQRDMLSGENTFLTIERKIVLKLADDDVREQPRTGKTFLDGFRRKFGCNNARILVGLLCKFGADYLHAHKRCRSPLQRFAHVFADFLVIRRILFNLERRGQFDAFHRQMLGQRLPSVRCSLLFFVIVPNTVRNWRSFFWSQSLFHGSNCFGDLHEFQGKLLVFDPFGFLAEKLSAQTLQFEKRELVEFYILCAFVVDSPDGILKGLNNGLRFLRE